MKIQIDPRLPFVTAVKWREDLTFQLTKLFRDIADQINGITEGRLHHFYNARSTAPTSGDYQTGDYVPNSAPANGEYRGWVYGGSSFIGMGQIGALKGTTANRPTKTTLGVANDADWAGHLYFDTTLAAAGKPIWWTGAAWVDATGAAV